MLKSIQICLRLEIIISMSEVKEEQINCIIEADGDVAIFDRDNWVSEEDTNIPSNRQIFIHDQNNKCDEKMMSKIEQELQISKENFFKVKLQKRHFQKKKPVISINQKSLKRIQVRQKDPNSILKEGYLQKNTNGFIFRWLTRYFALTSQKLFFFEDQKKDKPVGCINFKTMWVEVKPSPKQLTLDFNGEFQTMILRSQSKQLLKQWAQLLTQVIKFHSKQLKPLLKTMIKPLYDFKDSITEKQFHKVSETGDILLFYTRHTGARIQRVLTNSDYDHVAMVVKINHNETFVFESNQTYGVSIFDWNQYIRFFNLYEKVTLRKLQTLRKKELHHSLLRFVKKNLGKKYDISAFKLLKLESDFDWDATKQDANRGFFCSQLIAKAYKSVGLLVEEKKYSGRYWPVDFSQRCELKLKGNGYLGSEQSIILNRNIKNLI